MMTVVAAMAACGGMASVGGVAAIGMSQRMTIRPVNQARPPVSRAFGKYMAAAAVAAR